jgi:hypothetical protein
MRFPGPLRHGEYEHRWFRALFAAAALLGLFTKPVRDGDFSFPKGIAAYVDLTFLQHDATLAVLLGLAVVAAVLFALGRAVVPAALYLFLISVAVFTANMSNAPKTRHDTNIIPLVLLGILLAHLHGAFLRRRDAASGEAPRIADLGVFYAGQMIAASYVVSGITKLWKTGGEWLEDSPLIALQVVRTQHCEFYSYLAPAGDLERWFGFADFLVRHDWLTRGMFGAALALELFTFVALFGRIPAALIGLALIGFHLSVLALMNINFYLNVLVLAIFFVNVPYWVVRLRSRRAVPGGLALP